MTASPRAVVGRASTDRWWALVLALAVALPFAGAPRGQFGDDDLEYAVPFARFVLDELAEGRWPVWNPATDAGVPLAVQQPWMGPAYPGLGFFAVLSDGRALQAGYALHAALLAVGTFLLMRRLGLGRPAAVAAAFVMGAGSDVAVAWNRGYLHHLVSVSWLPWPLLAFEHARRSERRIPASVGLGAMAVGASFLGGHPVSAMQMLLAFGCWAGLAALAEVGATGARNAARTLSLAAAMAVGGVLLASVQLVPLQSMAAEGSLAAERAYKPWDAEMARPWRDVGYLLPRWEAGHKGRPFVGLVVALLVPLGLAALDRGGRHRSGMGGAALSSKLGTASVTGARAAVAPVGTAVVFWLLAAGPHLPVLGWASALLPPLGAVSYSYFFAPPVHLGLAWLAGVFLHVGLSPRSGSPLRMLAVLLGSLVAAAVAVAALASRVAADPLDPDGLTRSAAPVLLAVGSLVAVLVGAAKGRLGPHRAAWVLVALVALELAWYRVDARVVKPTYTSAEFFRVDDPLVEAARRTLGYGRLLHVQDRAAPRDWRLRRNGGLLLGYEEVRRSARLGWAPYARFTDALEPAWLDWEAALTRADTHPEPRPLEIGDAELAVLDGLAVDRVLTDVPIVGPRADAYEPTMTRRGATLYRRVEPTARVTLEPPAVGATRVVERTAARWVIEVEADPGGMLVLREAAVDGWSARLDGEPAEVVRADGVFVATSVPAGQHRIELTFAPPAWPAWTSAATLAMLGAVAAWPRRRARGGLAPSTA